MKFILRLMSIGFVLLLLGVLCIGAVIYYFSRDLPDQKELAELKPSMVTRLYADDGSLLNEYFIENRVYVPYEYFPKTLVNAFVAAEDKNFFNHSGVDFKSTFRALLQNLGLYGTGGTYGGSTITQQVVKNFLLTNEKTYERKIKEAILAFRVTNDFSKEKILEIYMNQIFMGNNNYGVATAALYYFDKSVNELNLPESAMLAALPKAPSKRNPVSNPEEARIRRDYVLRRMKEDGYITPEEAEAAINSEVEVRIRNITGPSRTGHFSEAARRQVKKLFGDDSLYKGGLAVQTTMDPNAQNIAESSLEKAIHAYDKRHGYRGGIGKIKNIDNWQEELKKLDDMDGFAEDWQKAVVQIVSKESVDIIFQDGSLAKLKLKDNNWAKKYVADVEKRKYGYKKFKLKSFKDVLEVNDIIIATNKDGVAKLEQIPEVNGATVVMDPHSGKILAMVGGNPNKKLDEFNRSVQAMRQPGSTFKPFVYLAGLEKGIKPNTIIVDAPIEILQKSIRKIWTPLNSGGDFLGQITTRTGLERSRNTIAIRVGLMAGLNNVSAVAQRFGILSDAKLNLSLPLGSAETTLLRMVNAYAMLANGGRGVKPYIIERIQDKNGKMIYSNYRSICQNCNNSSPDYNRNKAPLLNEDVNYVANPAYVYQIVSMMKGVIQRGTATKANVLGIPMAGKTGTTNDAMDAWFIGFTPDLVVGTYVGFDQPRSLGKQEFGGTVALPVFVEIMKELNKGKKAKKFKVPEDIYFTKVDRRTGLESDELTPDKYKFNEAFYKHALDEVIYAADYDHSLDEFDIKNNTSQFEYSNDDEGNSVYVPQPYSGTGGVY